MSNNSISIDYGTKKSGLAYSIEGFAFSYKTVQTKILLQELQILIERYTPQSIIVGMPYNMDGTLSEHSQRVKTFSKILKRHFPTLEILFHDERLTTAEALLEGVDDIDAESARLILEDYIKNTI